MENPRLIIVANRLPFKMKEKEGEIHVAPSSGGLVSSIHSYLSKVNSRREENNKLHPLWVGAADASKRIYNEYLKSEHLVHRDFDIKPVFLPRVTAKKYYNGFCNDLLWPLFHYFPSFAKFKEEYYEHYVKANILFCKKVLEIYQSGDLIWIHDYHLMLLPELIRTKLPNAAIGFFMHIPFPSFEIFRLLPDVWRKSILSGMLGADLVAFHTNSYSQHFIKSVREILGFDNSLRVITSPERTITVDTFPVSINYDKFTAAADDPEIFAERNKIKKSLYEVKLIISVDRLDYTKGIYNRLEAFQLFLEKNADLHNKVVYVLVVVPSRDVIRQYKEKREEIEGLVSQINGKFGNIDWTPVVYQYQSLDFKKLTALYLAADVALITPLRDGMNLVAKEFIAARKDKRGVLILSETAGAASELGEALIINPTDIQQMANILLMALHLPVAEQARRMEAMQKRLQYYDVVKWADNFLSQLKACKVSQNLLNVKIVTRPVEDEIISKYSSAKKRLLFLDYDGTLTPIEPLPHLAVPSNKLLALLAALGHAAENTVVLVSGRSKEALLKWLGNTPICLAAEHGAFVKTYDSDWNTQAILNLDWKEILKPIFTMFTERCSGAFIEEKETSMAWHYRNADRELGFFLSRELINSLMELSLNLNFEVIEGRKVVEARIRGIHKGTVVTNMLASMEYDFILAIGDDKTDEDLFKAIPPGGYSIRVGLNPSMARYNFKHQYEVIELLEKLSSSDRLHKNVKGELVNNNLTALLSHFL